MLNYHTLHKKKYYISKTASQTGKSTALVCRKVGFVYLSPLIDSIPRVCEFATQLYICIKTLFKATKVLLMFHAVCSIDRRQNTGGLLDLSTRNNYQQISKAIQNSINAISIVVCFIKYFFFSLIIINVTYNNYK